MILGDETIGETVGSEIYKAFPRSKSCSGSEGGVGAGLRGDRLGERVRGIVVVLLEYWTMRGDVAWSSVVD